MIVLSGADLVLPDRVLSPGTLVLDGDREQAGVGEQDRTHGEAGFFHGQPHDQNVQPAVAEPGERVDEGSAADLQLPLRVP